LLDHLPGVRTLVVGGRRRDEHRLRQQSLEFVEPKRPVIERRRQPKAIVDEIFLARTIAAIHSAGLRHRDVTFVDEHQCIARQIIDERRRRLAGLTPRQMS
jgi:hypothetical protein